MYEARHPACRLCWKRREHSQECCDSHRRSRDLYAVEPKVFCLMLLAACIGPAFQQQSPQGPDAHLDLGLAGRRDNSLYYIDRENYAQIAAAVGSDHMEIVLTTISFHHNQENASADQLDLMKNFAFFLHQSGRLQNTFIFSYDPAACRALLDRGILCFMDEAAPQPSEMQGTALTSQS